jgi:hypothetical protein
MVGTGRRLTPSARAQSGSRSQVVSLGQGSEAPSLTYVHRERFARHSHSPTYSRAVASTYRGRPELRGIPVEAPVHSGHQGLACRCFLRSTRSWRIPGSNARVLGGFPATDPTGPAGSSDPGEVCYTEGTWPEVSRSPESSDGSSVDTFILLPTYQSPSDTPSRMETRTRER